MSTSGIENSALRLEMTKKNWWPDKNWHIYLIGIIHLYTSGCQGYQGWRKCHFQNFMIETFPFPGNILTYNR